MEAQLSYDLEKYSSQSQVFRCFTAVNSQSNFYVANTFNGSVNIEPGNSSYNLASNGGADFYVAKYNSNLNKLRVSRRRKEILGEVKRKQISKI
ncbi:hypothetical protein [Lacihabitans lacunae]|uniref:Uncharacterized protein n=1 Tax=Lacihabitans lacunae TaxID=1028214 RepID=A0ABV7YZ87_9BACT